MIALIDYKAGNLNSVAKAFEKIGAKNFITQDPKDLQKADKLLLPGVGSFKEAMKNLKGLGFIEGEVVKFEEDLNLKIPHMGWNELEILKQEPLYQGIDDKSDFYFVHSFYVKCKDEFVSAKAQYGHRFVASLQKDHIFATQFHPEKSQNLGLKLLENFIRL